MDTQLRLKLARAAGQQRHKSHRNQVLANERAVRLFVELDDELRVVARTERQDHFAAIGKLSRQSFGYLLGGGGDQDAIERCEIRRALRTVTDDNGDIAIAQRLDPLSAPLRQASGTARR